MIARRGGLHDLLLDAKRSDFSHAKQIQEFSHYPYGCKYVSNSKSIREVKSASFDVSNA
jgi:hypothetical protein